MSRRQAVLAATGGAVVVGLLVIAALWPRPRTGDAGARPGAHPRDGERGGASLASGPARSGGGAATTGPAATPAAVVRPAAGRPRPPLPEGTSLRGLRGVVRDGATGEPIAGAWVSWRAPRLEMLGAVLAAADPATPRFRPERFSSPGFGALTDAAGRFVLSRLPDDADPASLLWAVAADHAVVVTRPGLAAEVAIELQRAATLTVSVPPSPDGWEASPGLVASAPSDPAYQTELLDRLDPDAEGPQRDEHVFPCLAPGAYEVTLHGEVRLAVSLAPGEERRVALDPPARLHVTGIVIGAEARARGARLVLRDRASGARKTIRLDAEGRFDARLRPGRYTPLLGASDGSERRLDPNEIAAAGEHRLQPATTTAPIAVHVEAADGQPWSGPALVLVALEGEPAERFALASAGAPGAFQARVSPGRYALLAGRDVLAASVDVAEATLVVRLAPRSLHIAWTLPPELASDESLRAVVTLLPESLGDRPELQEQGERRLLIAVADPVSVLEVPGGGGRFVLAGRTDLGAFRAAIEVPSGGADEVAVTVSLIR